MRIYETKLTGITPLLMHRDNIEYSDYLAAWRADPENKKMSIAGDDRSPAHTWLGSIYYDEGQLAIPGDNIMRCLLEGGTMVPVPGGKGNKTFKAQTQSGMMTEEAAWPLYVDGKTIASDPLFKLQKERDFKKHIEAAVQHGFSLFIKRAGINNKKHIRVRPKFSRWELRGHIRVWDDQITTDVLTRILHVAGEFKGLCDWRPSSPTPGAYGRFTATLKEVG